MKGFVELEAHQGSDLDIVNAARVSFHKRTDIYGEAERAILRFLMKNRHGTPFEHTFLKFHVRAPLFVVREWQRHRIGVSYNEESGRYVELRPDFYIPIDARTQVGKPGAYVFEKASEEVSKSFFARVLDNSYRSYYLYRDLLKEGVAKEQARIVLPLNLYTEFYFTCNARSLMAFLSLRNKPDAMEEIRLYAEALEELAAKVFPDSITAFIDADRNCP